MQVDDYKNRSYLSAIESAKYLNLSVKILHNLTKMGVIKAQIATSGQMRFDLKELKKYEENPLVKNQSVAQQDVEEINIIEINKTIQKIFVKNSARMEDTPDNSIHLMVTSPPYFNTKMYSKKPIENDVGNISDVDEWFDKISEVWKEVYRVLQPGRKVFINIMNLPVRENGSFRTLNLVGRTIDVCEKIGFIFKRDIVWHKTNSVRAHFGTYPYPGGILINNMHEFILEFDKPSKKGVSKYRHLTKEQKEESKLDKEFWVSIKKSDVWVMKPQLSGDKRTHIAPFPYELPYRLIKAFSFVGETVLDPFLGSGIALKAAADLKRNGIGYEINHEIALDAVKNLNNYQQGLF
ncbi:MAG: site-specific DNA-methyltransferase [bacterium]|nr:site-specific DNA-methyltransferase [bacterium]